MAFLTFLPFVLTAKGASLQTVGLALTLVFAGGAVGKLVCAFIGARIGAVATVWLTEIVTAAAILALLPLPLDAAMFLLPDCRRRAQWHFVGTIRLGARPGAGLAACAGVRHFLYGHDRGGGDLAGAVRPAWRFRRGAGRHDCDRLRRIADTAFDDFSASGARRSAHFLTDIYGSRRSDGSPEPQYPPGVASRSTENEEDAMQRITHVALSAALVLAAGAAQAQTIITTPVQTQTVVTTAGSAGACRRPSGR